MTWCVCACVDNKGPGLVPEALAGSIRHLLGASDFKQKCDLKFSEEKETQEVQ